MGIHNFNNTLPEDRVAVGMTTLPDGSLVVYSVRGTDAYVNDQAIRHIKGKKARQALLKVEGRMCTNVKNG